mgnify:CR=1 FL=1
MNADILIRKIQKLNEETEYNKEIKRSLNIISKFCYDSTGKKNTWKYNNRNFFIEWPLFGEDFEYVEGVIYENIGSVSRKSGEYKIGVSGNVIEFPFLPPEVINRINRKNDSSDRR